MARNHDDRNTIRQYLLRGLDNDQQQGIEKRLLVEDDLLEELEIAEDELIDEYLTGKLADKDRERFEQNFLTISDRHQKVRFSRSFNRYLRTSEGQEKAAVPFRSHFWSTHNWGLPAAATAAILVIVAGIFWFSRPRTPPTPTFATLTLTMSTSTRAEGAPATKLTLPLDADALRLRLELPERSSPATRHRVKLLTANGDTQTLPTIGQDEKSIVVEIPAAQLSRGQYAVKLFAVQSDGTEQPINGSYYFTVE
jgi:hypothetical protein